MWKKFGTSCIFVKKCILNAGNISCFGKYHENQIFFSITTSKFCWFVNSLLNSFYYFLFFLDSQSLQRYKLFEFLRCAVHIMVILKKTEIFPLPPPKDEEAGIMTGINRNFPHMFMAFSLFRITYKEKSTLPGLHVWFHCIFLGLN